MNPDVDDMWRSYVSRGGEIVVCVEDGGIVGTGTLLPEPDGGGRIMRMSVARTRRRRGIGRLIVTALVRRADQRGLRPTPADPRAPRDATGRVTDRSCRTAACGRRAVRSSEPPGRR
jgi:GNAT superfamily N-acetyltransferase